MTFLAKIKDKGFDFCSDYNRARFLQFAKENEGKRVRIELDEAISQEARGYFEGAIVPTFVEHRPIQSLE